MPVTSAAAFSINQIRRKRKMQKPLGIYCGWKGNGTKCGLYLPNYLLILPDYTIELLNQWCGRPLGSRSTWRLRIRIQDVKKRRKCKVKVPKTRSVGFLFSDGDLDLFTDLHYAVGDFLDPVSMEADTDPKSGSALQPVRIQITDYNKNAFLLALFRILFRVVYSDLVRSYHFLPDMVRKWPDFQPWSVLFVMFLFKLNYLCQGSILDSHVEVLNHRLRGLCDNVDCGQERFHEKELVSHYFFYS